MQRLLCVILLGLGLLTACRGPWFEGQPSHSDQLGRYIEEHYRAQGQTFRPPFSREQFHRRLQHYRVLFLGDHHRDEVLHAQMFQLIHELTASGRPLVLGLEAVGQQDNPDLQEYLQDSIGLGELQTRMLQRWQHSWLDNLDVDAGFFRALLRHCKQAQIPVFPLEPTPRLSLRARDRRIAKSILNALQLYPEHLIVVLVGHAHLLGPHHVLEQVDLEVPCLAISARMAPRLRAQVDRGGTHTRAPADGFLRSDQELLFFAPPQTSTALRLLNTSRAATR